MEKSCQNRIFVGRIHSKVNEVSLKEHFQQFGAIESVEIKRHKKTGASKRYGFINCEDTKTYFKILSIKHSILGQPLNCNTAFRTTDTMHLGDSVLRKVFLRGITASVSDKDLFYYFKRFGKVIKAYGLRDACDQEPKGFGFVEFETQGQAKQCLQYSHTINGINLGAEIYVPGKQTESLIISNPLNLQSSESFFEQCAKSNPFLYKIIGQKISNMNICDLTQTQIGIIVFDNKLTNFKNKSNLFERIHLENAIDTNTGLNYSFNLSSYAQEEQKLNRINHLLEKQFSKQNSISLATSKRLDKIDNNHF